MAKTTYQTGARTQLLDFFNRNPDRQFTADELCEYFSAPVSGKAIAKSTLYRQLCALCREGLLQRFDGTDPRTGNPVRYYQPVGDGGDCMHHFHLKCLRCGELQHLECDRTVILLSHLLDAHRFTVDCGRSILYGICHACEEAERDAAEREEDEATLCPCGCGKAKHRVKDYGLTR
ncbi:MAG: transcriptional repressor [Clostridia bacterium]|nr:transcriptional repressor [Clostridia bacterium]